MWHKMCLKVAYLTGSRCGIELNELPYGTSEETEKTKRERKFMLEKISWRNYGNSD